MAPFSFVAGWYVWCVETYTPRTRTARLYSWIECPCHYRHTHVLSVSRIARTDPRPATSVSELEAHLAPGCLFVKLKIKVDITLRYSSSDKHDPCSCAK